MKISFDFDQTLSEKHIQDICYATIKAGHHVVILTSRLSPEFRKKHYGSDNHRNGDLYTVADRLGIKEIIFTNGQFKAKFLVKHNIDLHYDDMEDEIHRIQRIGKKSLLFNSDLSYKFNNFDYSNHLLNNTVFKSINNDKCLDIQNYFEKNGVDVEEFDFIYSEENNDEFIYYGLVDGIFDNYSIDFLKNKKVIYGIV